MLFDLKIDVVKNIGAIKNESGIVLFVEKGKSKKKFEEKLSSNKIQFSESIFKKYQKESSSFALNPSDGKFSFVKIIKYESAKLSSDYFRDQLAGVVKSLSGEDISELFVNLPDYNELKEHFDSQNYFFQSAAEGLHLGNYDFNLYKSEKKKTNRLTVKIIASAEKSAKRGVNDAAKLIKAVYLTKNFVNEPAITLTPKELAKRTKSDLTKLGIRVTVFNKNQLKEKKMNAVLAVGSAAANDPCMIIMHYKPKVKSKKKIALVGKGVTYDTGGLSIKPTSNMLDMKADMAGAAAVIGTVKAAAELKLPYEIIGVVPAVENAIAGNAYKPGDVVKAASGKSIEVKNTDAEGRIILADALEYASKQKPDEIIDFATLTGSIVAALGEYAAGLFTKNDSLAENLTAAGLQTHERVWRMPFWDDYNKLIKSDIADVNNIGGKWGGSITAGKFLEYFVDEKIPWAHIDIAGVALANDLNNYTKKWHTGFGVRLMIGYLRK